MTQQESINMADQPFKFWTPLRGKTPTHYTPESLGEMLLYNPRASANGGKAFGYCAQADGPGAIAVGKYTIAEGFGAQAIGNYAIAYGNAALALGYKATTHGCRALARGDYAYADGHGARATGFRKSAIGQDVRRWQKHERAPRYWYGDGKPFRPNSFYEAKRGLEA